MHAMPRIRAVLIAFLVSGIVAANPLRADEVTLKPDHPDRYVVVKGDTLWDISARFLRSPWHWPRIWNINEQIANPHLIYPGDVILLRYDAEGRPVLTVERAERLAPRPTERVEAAPGAEVEERRPTDSRTVRLSPTVREEPLEAAIPTIPPAEIDPFLSAPLVVGREELRDAGYVTTGLDDRIILGAGADFYARGVDQKAREFKIFRQGRALRHPESGEVLAYEAIDLGDARMVHPGDPTRLTITAARQEIAPTDRLLAIATSPGLPYYQPRSPTKKVHGWILLGHNAVAEIGPKTVVAISVGRRDGIEEGHVLRVMRHVGRRLDPVTRTSYTLPEEESGLVMVFRVFERVSYALVMNATRPIHINDAVETP
jgi:hypothetical protein